MKDSKREKLIPELRFPEFEGEWEEVVFSNYFKFLRSNSFSRNQLNYKCGEVLNIHYGDIHTKFSSLFFVSRERVPFINSDINLSKFKESDYLKEGDLVIADASEDYKDIGKSIEIIDLSGKKVVAGLHTIPARPGRDHALGFLGNLMKTFRVRHQIMRNANGISVLGISKTNIAKLKLTLPSPEEQQKIASFLSLIDKKIELLKKKKELLELYKKGVMQKIFNQEIRFKDKDGNDYSEWEEKRLGEILQEYVEKTTEENQFLILSSTKEGLFLQEEYFNRAIASENNTGYKILRKNQLVFSPQNLWLGNINFNEKYEAGIVSPSYKIFNVDETKAYPLFLKYIIKLPRMIYKYMTCSEQGASIVRRNLNMKLFKQIKIKLPRKKEQREIYQYLEELTFLTALTKDDLVQVSLFKKGLLQKMFI